jgi:long-chain acyl-CoA synthetase
MVKKPSAIERPDLSRCTIPQMVLGSGALYAGRPLCRVKRNGAFHDITWQTFEKELCRHAGALKALGLAQGDRVAIMAPNGPNWVWADIACQLCGAASVPIYHTEGLANTLYILSNSGSRVLFIWSQLVAQELLQHLDEVPRLETLILLRGGLDHARVIPLRAFLDRSAAIRSDELRHCLQSGQAEDMASIVYTSGTTGPPKGVILSHRNFLSNVSDCAALFPLGPTDTCLSFLPLSHVFERMAGYYLMLYCGVTIAYAESIDSVPVDLLTARPTVMISVPRLYEKVYARVMDKVVSGPWLKRSVFFRGLKLCVRRIDHELAGDPVPAWLKWLTDLLRRKVFVKLRTPLGGRVRFFVSGGAPLARNVAEFFLAAGLPIYEGYGLTETSPVISVNTPARTRLGTIGPVLPQTSVRIADDGEILVKGPGVFSGYWEDPEMSRAALADGWFHTGDIGQLDEQGFLSITDRKKDLIVTAGGENIAPQLIEKRLKADKFIANVLVYGDRKPFLTALLVPNFDNLSRYARMKRIDFLTHCDLVNHPQILDLMRRRVERLQQGQPGFLQIRRFTLLSRDFLAESGELTQTLKIKRRSVARKFHQVVEGMYLERDHGSHDHGFCIIDD